MPPNQVLDSPPKKFHLFCHQMTSCLFSNAAEVDTQSFNHNSLFVLLAILILVNRLFLLYCPGSTQYSRCLTWTILEKYFTLKIFALKSLHSISRTLIRSIHISNTRDCSSVKIYYCHFTSFSHSRAQNTVEEIPLVHRNYHGFACIWARRVSSPSPYSSNELHLNRSLC